MGWIRCALLLILVAFAPAVLAGSGNTLPRASAEALAMADANVALVNSPSAQFINPANLVDSEARGPDWEAGVLIGRVDSNFTRSTPAGFGAALPGRFESKTQNPVIPFGAFTFGRSERGTWGVSIESPHGLEVEWPDGTFSVNLLPFGAPGTADLARKAELTVIRVGPAYAYAINDRWRIGGRVFAQYVDALDENDVSTASADGWTAGAQIGVRYKAEKLLFGAAYTSRTNTEVEGTLSNINPAAAGLLIPGPAKADILLPDRLQVGAAFRLRSNLWWELDLDWIGWSYVDELTIIQANGTVANAGRNNRASEDTLSVRTGVKWQYKPRLTFYAGVGDDPSPVPDQDVSPIMSMLEKTRLGLGVGYVLKSGLRMDLAYQYIRGHSRDVAATTQDNLAGVDTGVFAGRYSSDTHVLGVTFRGTF